MILIHGSFIHMRLRRLIHIKSKLNVNLMSKTLLSVVCHKGESSLRIILSFIDPLKEVSQVSSCL